MDAHGQPTERLRQLEELRARGLRTEDEYAARRRAFIDSIRPDPLHGMP